ncbi:hypothetical protein [Nocardioides sp. Soil774]|uniref:hypothetical protein n=1 Tax=Nocardioides sp. Soil774 TaxID=1736408 RepID=UPI0012F941C9|nr:hypothetical protein [Nocardioides sp. Soil774]
MATTLVPRKLRDAIEQAILNSSAGLDDLVADNLEIATWPRARRLPLAVKYVPSEYAADYRAPNPGLYIGANNYTWGRGVYVTGVSEPLSTAIYGRAGVLSRFDPAVGARSMLASPRTRICTSGGCRLSPSTGTLS